MRESFGAAQDERALPEITEGERREDEREPGDADGPAPEVAHVGVEGLAAGDGEDDDAEDGHPAEAVVREVERAPVGRHGGEDDGVADNLFDAERADREKPDHHHRPEQPSDLTAPAPLDREEAEQDHARQRDNERVELRRGHVQPFDCAQHRDRRRDHPVAEEERGARRGRAM